MDVFKDEITGIFLKLAFTMFTIVFVFIRWIISRIQSVSDRISKIEGTCQEREKTLYKKEEKTGKAKEGEDSSGPGE